MQSLLFFSWSHPTKSSPKLGVDHSLALSPAFYPNSSIIPILVDNMVRVSTLVLATLAAVSTFAAPVHLALETRRSQGIEARATHRRQTTRSSDQFDLDIRGDEDGKSKIHLTSQEIKINKKVKELANFTTNKSSLISEEFKIKNADKVDLSKIITSFNSQPKSKKGKQCRSLGFSSSFEPLVRSTSPSYTGAWRSFIDNDFVLDTRHRRREALQDFIEKDSMFEARELDELD
ncbi:hypothetical protein BKA70DRAFT_1444292 [Coprinopsis sp. MPI-PUGE-AT-0042]|nr:hypothetical protein BKA70DRAFT_1444292 [Coprinopsis sp. MPI-PUGE-AT-0042]